MFPVQLVRGSRLTDRVLFTMLQHLRPHWPGGVPANVREALRDRKRLLDPIFHKVGQ
jgi:hypothetical protein